MIRNNYHIIEELINALENLLSRVSNDKDSSCWLKDEQREALKAIKHAREVIKFSEIMEKQNHDK